MGIPRDVESGADIKDALLGLIADIAEYAPYHVIFCHQSYHRYIQIIEKFFKQFINVPLAEYSEKNVEFLALYLSNVQSNIARKRNQKVAVKTEILDDSKFELYDYDLLWSVIVAPVSMKLSKKVKDQAVNALAKVVSNNLDLITNYLVKSGKCILSSRETVLTEMKIFRKLFLLAKTKSELAKTYSIASSVMSEIFKRFMEYKNIVNKMIAECGPNNNIKNIMSYVSYTFEWYEIVKQEFRREYNHEEYLRGYFEFIEFIIEWSESGMALSNDQLGELWKQFIQSPVCLEEKNLFYSYLMKYKEDAKAGYFIITTGIQEESIYVYNRCELR